MGEIAEAMINGELCQECGAWIDGSYEGIPRFCKSCQPKTKIQPVKKIKCTLCDRHLKPNGMKDHLRDFHQIAGA